MIAISATGQAAAQADDFPAEREAVQLLRAQIQAQHASASAACQQRFAVTDCTQKADATRREALADVRRQELVLDQRRRRAAGAQTQGRIDAKRQAQQEKIEQRAVPTQ